MCLPLLALGDVAGDLRGADDLAVVTPERRDRQGNRNQASILAPANRFVMFDALATLDALDHLALLVPPIRRDQDGNALAYDFFGHVAEEPRCRRVPRGEDTIEILAHDRIAGRFHDGCDPLGLVERQRNLIGRRREGAEIGHHAQVFCVKAAGLVMGDHPDRPDRFASAVERNKNGFIKERCDFQEIGKVPLRMRKQQWHAMVQHGATRTEVSRRAGAQIWRPCSGDGAPAQISLVALLQQAEAGRMGVAQGQRAVGELLQDAVGRGRHLRRQCDQVAVFRFMVGRTPWTAPQFSRGERRCRKGCAIAKSFDQMRHGKVQQKSPRPQDHLCKRLHRLTAARAFAS